MEQENLHFKIGVSGSSSKKQPKIRILINDQEQVTEQLVVNENTTQYFEFDVTVQEGACFLGIELLNKTTSDTVLDANGNIIEDLLLNIDSVEVDEIDLGSMLWTASDYRPDYPEKYRLEMNKQGKDLPVSVKNCVNLGWNGRWTLPFTSPFYIWLLENI
jgi:hypothetical protein